MNVEQKTVDIPAPEFEIYERVNLSWNGEHETKIVARWYDYDKQQWWYKCQNQGERFYPQDLICHIIDGKLWGRIADYQYYKNQED